MAGDVKIMLELDTSAFTEAIDKAMDQLKELQRETKIAQGALDHLRACRIADEIRRP